MRFSELLSVSASALVATALLSGCALTNTATSGTSAGALLKGNVHGGQQPVVGAHVYLFAAGTSGYGGASVSLLDPIITGQSDSVGAYVSTDANGGFSITGDYTCTAGSQVYLLATGGNPGLPDNQINSSLALMTALGQCPASGSFAANIPFVAINEVTTVASVYAVSGFMTDLTHVSSSGTALALTGIANAFATTNNLVDISSGAALAVTPAGNGIAPQLDVNTIADIIASCVNSSGASSTTCATLFSTALNGTAQPTDTVTATLNIAHNPSVGVTTLYALIPSTPPFVAIPNTFRNHDLVLNLKFSGGGIQVSTYAYNSPYHDHIAIDANGNIWKTNPQTGSLSKLSNLGEPISPSTGYLPFSVNAMENLAIDPSGDVWISGGNTNNSISQLDGSTGVATGLGVLISGNLDMFSIDGFGNIWALQESANTMDIVKIDHLTHTTTTFSGGGLDSSSVGSSAWGIAVSGNNNVWVLNSNTGLSEFDNTTGTAISPVGGYSTGLPTPNGMILDGNGNLWIADFLQYSVTNISSTGNVLLSTNPSTGVALDLGPPSEMAIDGANSIWVINGLNHFLVHLDSSSGAAIPARASYYQGDTSASNLSNTQPLKPISIAVDSSGNIWATDVSQGTNGDIIEYVGLATPVATPASTAIAKHAFGARP